MEENKINRIADSKTAFAYASDILMSHLNDTTLTNVIAPEKGNQVPEQEMEESEMIVLEKLENISSQPDSIPTLSKNKKSNDYWNLKKIRSSFYKFFK